MNDIHVVGIFRQCKTLAATSRVTVDVSRSHLDLNVRTHTERLRKYLKAFMCLQSMGPRNTKFQATFEAGVSHLKSLTEIHRGQSERRRWFLHEGLHHSWSRCISRLCKILDQCLELKWRLQFAKFMTNCQSIVLQCQKSRGIIDHVSHNSSARLATVDGRNLWDSHTTRGRGPLDPEMVVEIVKEELLFTRTLRVYHGSLVSTGQV